MALENNQALPTPYEDGDHCIFYAVQDASMFFNDSPMSKLDRDKYKLQRERILTLYKAITGTDEKLGGWLQISAAFILSKLKLKGIVPEKLICSNGTKEIIESVKTLSRQKFKYSLSTDDEGIDIQLPALFFLEGNDGHHVWFAGNIDEFNEKHPMHTREGDSVVLMAELRLSEPTR